LYKLWVRHMEMPNVAKETAFWKVFQRLRGKTPQRVVAARIGVSPQAVQGWKHGAAPKLDTRRALAKYFGVPLATLVTDEEDARTLEPGRIADAVGVIGGVGVFAAALEIEPNAVQSWIDGSSVPGEAHRKRIGAILHAAEERNFHYVRSSTSGGGDVTNDAVQRLLRELDIRDPVERMHVAGLIEVWKLDEAAVRRLVEARRAAAPAPAKTLSR
jgi:hypothetical protein